MTRRSSITSPSFLLSLAFAGVVAVIMWQNTGPSYDDYVDAAEAAPIEPNWAAIASWPALEIGRSEAMPDPGRRFTAIILDDSGSMGNDMQPAKQAVLDTLGAMQPGDRVAVIGLNSGLILDFMPVAEAAAPLAGALQPVFSDGPTPLTRAVAAARALLEAEAAAARGFGTYQMIITTDGAADDGFALTGAIEDLAANTPIQIATIGIGIGANHVLRRPDLGSFVDVTNIGGLQEALRAAVAENAAFEAITDFDTGGEGN